MTSPKEDVERYFAELQDLLQQAGHTKDSAVMKTALKLQTNLSKDGFVVAEDGEEVVKAFMVCRQADADIVSSIFSLISGWDTRTLAANGKVVIVVGNTTLNKDVIKKAVLELKK